MDVMQVVSDRGGGGGKDQAGRESTYDRNVISCGMWEERQATGQWELIDSPDSETIKSAFGGYGPRWQLNLPR